VPTNALKRYLTDLQNLITISRYLGSHSYFTNIDCTLSLVHRFGKTLRFPWTRNKPSTHRTWRN